MIKHVMDSNVSLSPQGVQRKIIHIDFDAFYASIEVRDNPKLSGLPVAVGGLPERRGVVATCSYEARRFGVRSAMSSAQALRLCPELKIIPPRFAVYREASAQAHAIFRQYTDQIEPLSLDEAYLDVTASPRCRGSATLIAQEIRREVAQTQRTFCDYTGANRGLSVYLAGHQDSRRWPGNGWQVATKRHQDLRAAAPVLDCRVKSLVRQLWRAIVGAGPWAG